MKPERQPSRLWIVRHGESAGNVARAEARAARAQRIAIEGRDVDVPLSPLGLRQAQALGRWFAGLPEAERPEAVLTSPYVRARQTADAIVGAGGAGAGAAEPCGDERLREREFGVLDGLTTLGIRALYPDQAALRASLGKFYHRPPGGESWCDVILRLRAVLDTLSLRYAGRRVLVVCHQVVVLCFRYVLEGMDEAEVLAIDRAGEVGNCSVTEYAPDGPGGPLALVRYNVLAPLEDEGAPVTFEPDHMPAGR